MPRHPLVRLAHRALPWPGALIAGILTALLVTAVHCSVYLLGDGLEHASTTVSATELMQQRAPAEPQEPGHPHQDHGSACTSPGLVPQALSGFPFTAGATQCSPLPLPASRRRQSRPHRLVQAERR